MAILNWTDLTHESSRPVVTDLITAAIVSLTLVNVLAGGGVRGESVAGVAGAQLGPLLQVAELVTPALLLAPLPLTQHCLAQHRQTPRHLSCTQTVIRSQGEDIKQSKPFQVPF